MGGAREGHLSSVTVGRAGACSRKRRLGLRSMAFICTSRTSSYVADCRRLERRTLRSGTGGRGILLGSTVSCAEEAFTTCVGRRRLGRLYSGVTVFRYYTSARVERRSLVISGTVHAVSLVRCT